MKRLFNALILIAGLYGTAALAADSTPLIVPIGGINEVQNPSAYFVLLFEYAIGLAALLALAMLVYGAVQYTASAGFPSLQENAKSRIRNALFGLVLLLASITILITLGGRTDEKGNLVNSLTPLPAGSSATNANPPTAVVRGPDGNPVSKAQIQSALDAHTAILNAKPDYKGLEQKILADATNPSLTPAQRTEKMQAWERVTHAAGYPGLAPFSGENAVSLGGLPAKYFETYTQTFPSGGSVSGITDHSNVVLESVAWQAALEQIAVTDPAAYNTIASSLKYNWISHNLGTDTYLLGQQEFLGTTH